MNKNLARVAIAALAFGSAGLAQAVPIYFEFSGSVSQASATTGLGTAISGGFNLETDRLLSSGPGSGIQHSFVDWQPSGLADPLSFLDFAGSHHEIPAYSSSYAAISFADGCQPICNTGWSENFNLGAYTQDTWSAGFTGQLRSSSISLFNTYRNELADYPFYEGYDAFAGATAVPLDSISLPLAYLDGIFFESISDCVDGNCTTGNSDYFVFRVDTLTRGVGPKTVPEPGTLGLLATGMMLGFATRRRARARSAQAC
jgi:PEP-CTERM motif